MYDALTTIHVQVSVLPSTATMIQVGIPVAAILIIAIVIFVVVMIVKKLNNWGAKYQFNGSTR